MLVSLATVAQEIKSDLNQHLPVWQSFVEMPLKKTLFLVT